MAGWDKIRAAAQRPDCIFSAFPDGTDGAMYHPRSSLDESIVPISAYSVNNIIDGLYRSTGENNYNSGFRTKSILCPENQTEFSVLTKFRYSYSSDISTFSVGAISFCGNLPGSWVNGIRKNRITPGGSGLQMEFVTYYNLASGGTRAKTLNSGNTLLVPGTWYTLAMSANVETCHASAFVNGKKVDELDFSGENGTLIRDTSSFCGCSPGATAEVQYGLWFKRCLSDEEILYLMEE